MNIRDIDIVKITEDKTVSETIIEDMCLQYLKDRILDEDTLYNRFIEVITHPSTDADVLLERQAIFKDFITYGNLARDIMKYCEDAEVCRKNLKNVPYSGSDVTDKLKDYITETLPLLDMIEQFGRMFNKKFESRTLSEIKFGSMKHITEEIQRFQHLIKTNCLTLSVNFTDGLRLKNAFVTNTEKVNIKPSYKKDKMTKEYYLTDTDIVEYKANFMVDILAIEYRTSAILHLCSVISQLANNIIMFFRKLKQDIYFYLAALKIKKHMDDNGLSYCFPTVSDCITAESVYNYPLAVYYGTPPVGNDIDCSDSDFLIVTGLNQGGKTTFLRSIGVAQLFAQAGLMVPAVKYSFPVFNGFLSHFPKEEDTTLNFGKLAEELSRLQNELPVIAHGGFVMLNESFATTTEKEGTEIAADVLRALSMTDSTVIFVTHLYELAMNLDKLNGTLYNHHKAENYVTKVNPELKAVRSYKIVRGEPLHDMQLSDLKI